MKSRGYFFLATMSLVFPALLGTVQAQVGPPAGGGRMMMQQNPNAGKGAMQQDPVAKLNRILQKANASPLSPSQEKELTTLVDNFRAAHPWGNPDPAIDTAKRDLETAILSKNEGGVDAPASAIAAHISEKAAGMIRDSAKFQIQVLTLLSNDQVSALRTQFGNSGLLMTLRSLAGGPFHRGFGAGRGMGPGMGMHRGW